MFLPLFEMINDVRDPHSIGVLKGNIRRNIKVYEEVKINGESGESIFVARDIVAFYYSTFSIIWLWKPFVNTISLKYVILSSL